MISRRSLFAWIGAALAAPVAANVAGAASASPALAIAPPTDAGGAHCHTDFSGNEGAHTHTIAPYVWPHSHTGRA